MYIVEVGLVRPLQTWDTLFTYCNNQLKKYIAPLLGLALGTLHNPSDVYVRSFHFNKILLHRSPLWSSLVPGPRDKSSSEITNPTSFTVIYKEESEISDWKLNIQKTKVIESHPIFSQ